MGDFCFRNVRLLTLALVPASLAKEFCRLGMFCWRLNEFWRVNEFWRLRDGNLVGEDWGVVRGRRDSRDPWVERLPEITENAGWSPPADRSELCEEYVELLSCKITHVKKSAKFYKKCKF